MTGKDRSDYAEDYTEPELRERLKEEIKASGRGGKPGQWSARKSQLLVQAYERAGGGYRHPERRTETQQHLERWSEQDWHTATGSADARDGDTTHRYLPDAAWRLLSPAERRATEQRKVDAGAQHVPNSEAAREARRAMEIADANAGDAVKAIGTLEARSALERVRRAEAEHGKGRKTVLEAVERRLAAL